MIFTDNVMPLTVVQRYFAVVIYRNNSIYWDPVCIGTPFVLEKNNYLNDYINWDILRFQKNFNNFATV